ncbi:MAG: hypothetical protein ACYSUC_07685 [Planctomycetota bacterium]|jgi:hypothetical protein
MNKFTPIVLCVIWAAILGAVAVGLRILLGIPRDSMWGGVVMGGVLGAGIGGGVTLWNTLKKRHTSDADKGN